MSRRRLVLLPLLSVALLVPFSAPGSAAPRPTADRQVTVMTRNLYLGSSLTPAVTATSAPAFVGAVAQIFATVQATGYPVRADALAAEVAAQHPDLVGLQEVARWTVVGPSPFPSLDFLAILQDRLAARGLHYAVAAVSNNADIGPVPLAAPCAPGPVGTCLVRFQDRDVILVNTDRSALSVGNARDGRYATQEVLTTPVGQLSFSRGWVTVDATLNGKAFRFASTHLETEDFPAVQQAQGREFLEVVKAPRAVIAVGDFNSAADGSTTTTYADLTADWFRDAAPGVGLTCCQNGTLSNPVSQLSSRIDLVLAHGAAQPVNAVRVGADPFRATPPLWPSDHAGVVATLRIP
jgi:endonuclease/exonuclease/phosphatase family metal-dependent hydrolase